MAGWGNVLAQGILGGVMGASTAAAQNADTEIKAKVLRDREEFLSKLRLGEYKAKQDMDIAAIPVKGAAETGVLKQREEDLREGRLETTRRTGEVQTETALARRQGETEQDLANAPRVRAEKVKDEQEVGGIKQGRRMAEIQAQGDNSIRVARASAEEARRNNWRPDEEGFYVDGDGNRVTRSERVEGRTVQVFVKAPKSKLEGRDANWQQREELDSLNRRIEVAERNGDDETLKRLLDEKEKLLGRRPRASNTSSSNRPPLSSFNR